MDRAPVIRSAEFLKAATQSRHYPPDDLPEVAFAGRSNVGKSSLINCLVQRKKLVRTSRTPGQTQSINFFTINAAFRFVDLPGYGFAKVPEQVRAGWRPMVDTYLDGRRCLRGVVQILDARRSPTANDLQLWLWLQNRRLPALAVLTKIDKIARTRRPLQLEQAARALGLAPADIVLFSALTGEGRVPLWDALLTRFDLAVDSA
jgi:GTP-binding protein